MYDPSHFNSSFPKLSVRGLRKRTELPLSKSFFLDLWVPLGPCLLLILLQISYGLEPIRFHQILFLSFARARRCLRCSMHTLVFDFLWQYCFCFEQQLKQGEVCGPAICSVVAPDCPWHDLRPFALLFAFEYFLDCLKNQGVGCLNCFVRLWVV
jgi:hypothetical protein